MGVMMSGRLVGSTGLELTHQDSGAVIRTTPPKDNGGDGSAFSPTDLAAVSLGACAVTTLALFAERNGIPLSGATFDVEKLMHVTPRRLGKVRLRVRLDTPCSDADFEKLVHAGKNCPVRLSLKDEIDVDEIYERG